MNENLAKVCRVCLAEGSHQIFQKSFNQENFMNVSSLNRILEKLRFVTMLKIDENENLPPMICDLCIVQLNVAYNFKRQATDSDAKLRQYLIENGISLRKDRLMLTAPPAICPQIRNGSISSSSVYELSTATTRDIQTPQSTTNFPQIRPISIKIETPEISDTQSTISPMSSSTNQNELPPIIITPSEASVMIGPTNNNNNDKDVETSGSDIMLNVASSNSSGSEVMVTVPNVPEHEFLRPIDPPPKNVEDVNAILVHPVENEMKNEINMESPEKKKSKKVKKGVEALLDSLKIDLIKPQTPEDGSKFRKRSDKVDYTLKKRNEKKDSADDNNQVAKKPSDKKEGKKRQVPKPIKEEPSPKNSNLKLNPVSVIIKRAKIPTPKKDQPKSMKNRKEKIPPQRKKADKMKNVQKNKLKMKLIKDKLLVKLKNHRDLKKAKNNKNKVNQKQQKNAKKQKRKD